MLNTAQLVDLWEEHGYERLFKAMGINWKYVHGYNFNLDEVDSIDDLVFLIIRERKWI